MNRWLAPAVIALLAFPWIGFLFGLVGNIGGTTHAWHVLFCFVAIDLIFVVLGAGITFFDALD